MRPFCGCGFGQLGPFQECCLRDRIGVLGGIVLSLDTVVPPFDLRGLCWEQDRALKVEWDKTNSSPGLGILG